MSQEALDAITAAARATAGDRMSNFINGHPWVSPETQRLMEESKKALEARKALTAAFQLPPPPASKTKSVDEIRWLVAASTQFHKKRLSLVEKHTREATDELEEALDTMQRLEARLQELQHILTLLNDPAVIQWTNELPWEDSKFPGTPADCAKIRDAIDKLPEDVINLQNVQVNDTSSPSHTPRTGTSPFVRRVERESVCAIPETPEFNFRMKQGPEWEAFDRARKDAEFRERAERLLPPPNVFRPGRSHFSGRG